ASPQPARPRRREPRHPRPRPGLAGRAQHPHHRPRRRRRQPGHRRPPPRPPPDRCARPERCRREPARRRQQHRLRGRVARPAGRLHAARRLRQPLHQPHPLPRPQLRPGGGLRARCPRGPRAADPRRPRRQQRRDAGGFPRRHPPRADRGRHARQWQPRPSPWRADPGRGGGALDAHPLSRRGAGGERPARRQPAGGDDQYRRGDGPCPGRAHARPLRLQRRARQGPARGPDPRRGRHDRRRGGWLARHRRPARHGPCHRRPPQCGDRPGRGQARGRRTHRRPRPRAGEGEPGGPRHPHPRRCRSLGRDHPPRPHPAGL
ncbi:MAG: BUG/TctC family periplasmic protein, partial [uncultured Craurococcus sp.]